MENKIITHMLNNIQDIKIENIKIKYNECDLVLSGGGFAGFYLMGFFVLLEKLIISNKLKIRNIYATSAGVLTAVLFLCNIDINKWLIYYYDYIDNSNNINVSKFLIQTLRNILPTNAHILCSGKLNIYLTKINYFKIKSVVINTFETFDYLIQVIEASINIPYIISHNCYGTLINNELYYDGGFTRNTPLIYNNDLPQLLVKTHKINYPLISKFFLNDAYLELLVLRGIFESYDFFIENTKNKQLPIYWIDKNYNKKTIPFIQKNIIKYIIPFMMFSYSLFM